uniref:C2H2-type domain-containing protein n=1 Tax=Romanomermis culicivorax TaxID=13658 RepID=A0A915IXY4_ROMCU
MLQLFKEENSSPASNASTSFYLTVKSFLDETPIVKRSPYLFSLTENVLILDVELLRDLTFKKHLVALSVNTESFPEIRQLAHFSINDDQSVVNLIIDPCEVLCSLGLCINRHKGYANSSVDIVALYCSSCRTDFANIFDSKIHFRSIQHNQNNDINVKKFAKSKHKFTKNKQVPILTASFACIYCPAKFTTVEYLRRHISIHNGYADLHKNYTNLRTSNNVDENHENPQLLCI